MCTHKSRDIGKRPETLVPYKAHQHKVDMSGVPGDERGFVPYARPGRGLARGDAAEFERLSAEVVALRAENAALRAQMAGAPSPSRYTAELSQPELALLDVLKDLSPYREDGFLGDAYDTLAQYASTLEPGGRVHDEMIIDQVQQEALGLYRPGRFVTSDVCTTILTKLERILRKHGELSKSVIEEAIKQIRTNMSY